MDMSGGNVMYFTSNKAPLRDENGEVIGIICNSLDITRQKEAEHELMEAKQQVEESDRAKTTFIQNMEHDIRTPFNGVYGFASVLAESEADQERKEFLKGIASCAKELLDYCDNILDFSRASHGATPLLERPFDITEVIESIYTIETIAAKHKGLDFTVSYGSELPKNIISDPYRLKKILLNLVSNAIKFTNEGRIGLDVSLAGIKPETRTCILKFEIIDTGIGIPEDKVDSIYEKFTRGTPSNQGVYKGPGLGLRLVKQFVDEFDGDIVVDTELNKGTTFTVFLPFKLPLTETIDLLLGQ
jgi:signal transduction histidine kinase